MAQVLKGSGTMKQGVPTQVTPTLAINKQSQSMDGAVIGAVINNKSPSPVSTNPQSQQSPPLAAPISPAAQGQGIITPGMSVQPVNPITGGLIAQNSQQQSMASNTMASDVGIILDCEINMANTKEKTPMCLINELARFNKIQHQYTLTDEQGPAHKKTFYVKLKLGEEEYAASGPSIKKAQHAAAAIALEKTHYKHPPPKPRKNYNLGIDDDNTITPTVELNALAMKRGEPAIYRPIEPQRPQYYPPPNFDFRGIYNQRYHYPRFPRVFYVSLKVGQREFIGEGQTRQAARHNAAAKALKVLRNLPLPNQQDKAKVPLVEENAGGEDDQDQLKSEISLVHEIALKRNLPVNFEVTKESGPPHMRTFVTRCTVGEFLTEGEGNSKKLSKKRAAEEMLEQLHTLPSLPTTSAKIKKPVGNKKKNRNLIKAQKASPDYGVGINPISRLIQIQQAKKEKEPVYTLIAERGMPRRREFVMQVTVGNHQCTGVGPNKKLAKRSAAEAMLQLLGYSKPSPQPSKPAIKTTEAQGVAADKKVTFLDQDSTTTRQLVPGVLLMPDGARTVHGYGINAGSGGSSFSPQTTAAIAKELLNQGNSPTAEALMKVASSPTPVAQSTVRPKQQLLYLAKVLGFEVQFTDFPKGTNKNEYLSLVSLSTQPPQVSHGAGPTTEDSHDIAALTALKALVEVGLESVEKRADKPDVLGSGDGHHIKQEPIDSIHLGVDVKDVKLANSGLTNNVPVKTEGN